MIVISCDDASTVGHAHSAKGEVGQDYALSGSARSDVSYAVVSDGCSSGGRTDVGARLLGLFMREYASSCSARLFPSESYDDLTGHLRSFCRRQQVDLRLERDDLFATALMVRADPCVTRVWVLGDGVVAARFRSGNGRLWKFEWSNNAPLYPAYEELELSQLAGQGAQLVITDADGNRSSHGVGEHHDACVLDFRTSELLDVAVFTDGVSQVRRGFEEASWSLVVGELMAFRNTRGVFAKRRLMSYLSKLRSEGYRPEDDLSMAVVHFEEV